MKYEELSKLIGKNVIKLRKINDLTQEELANRSELAARHIQKIEYGHVNITLKTISKLINAFNIEPIELFKK